MYHLKKYLLLSSYIILVFFENTAAFAFRTEFSNNILSQDGQIKSGWIIENNLDIPMLITIPTPASSTITQQPFVIAIIPDSDNQELLPATRFEIPPRTTIQIIVPENQSMLWNGTFIEEERNKESPTPIMLTEEIPPLEKNTTFSEANETTYSPPTTPTQTQPSINTTTNRFPVSLPQIPLLQPRASVIDIPLPTERHNTSCSCNCSNRLLQSPPTKTTTINILVTGSDPFGDFVGALFSEEARVAQPPRQGPPAFLAKHPTPAPLPTKKPRGKNYIHPLVRITDTQLFNPLAPGG